MRNQYFSSTTVISNIIKRLFLDGGRLIYLFSSKSEWSL